MVTEVGIWLQQLAAVHWVSIILCPLIKLLRGKTKDFAVGVMVFVLFSMAFDWSKFYQIVKDSQ